ncbi:MAG: glycoside hydrolase family 9 protein [Fibrobacteria bacterium]|nr:glycoside hydrolase family 9 protein [Fibrobacteria bacterium]
MPTQDLERQDTDPEDAVISRSIAVTLSLGITASFAADRGNPNLHANQVGYLPGQVKAAALRLAPVDSSFQIISEPGGEVVYEGFGGPKKYWSPADDTVRLYDFTAFRTPGTYRVQVPGNGVSYPFEISPEVYTPATKAAIKSYYYQRASIALTAEFAGKWARAAGHPDNQVLVHGSAATPERPRGFVLSSPKGWYDAGDYNKYVVNSGISTWTLLDAYLMSPAYFDTLNLNIPESSNDLPDLLDEALWNIDWVYTMQDLDGGVYHKLTTAKFSGFVMPSADKAVRYVVQKSTTATLDYAALMAQTSRIFRKFEAQRPGFADSCLARAIRAWDWAAANPSVAYIQDSLTNPTVATGEYGDGRSSDERIWAAMELTLATRRDSFWTAVFPTGKFSGTFQNPSWNQVSTLGLMSALNAIDSLVGVVDTSGMRSKLRSIGTEARNRMLLNPYLVPVGTKDLSWGSSSTIANYALLAFHWYKLSADTSYRSVAVTALDWLYGRNPLGVSFVTGFGQISPMHPHHRPSGADGIVEPIPGLVAGGPNGQRQDSAACEAEGASYPYLLSALSWIDAECSYASNEVAINWNAPLVALLGGIQADEIYGGATAVSPWKAHRSGWMPIGVSRKGSSLSVLSKDGTPLLEVRVMSASGRTLARTEPHSASTTLEGIPAGLVVVAARSAQGWVSTSSAGF